jgi:hypothetical protein
VSDDCTGSEEEGGNEIEEKQQTSPEGPDMENSFRSQPLKPTLRDPSQQTFHTFTTLMWLRFKLLTRNPKQVFFALVLPAVLVFAGLNIASNTSAAFDRPDPEPLLLSAQHLNYSSQSQGFLVVDSLGKHLRH